jgi:hypothetical protein
MIQPPLRLVVDRGAEPASAAVELFSPAAGSLHIHLHVGPQAGSATADASMRLEGHEKRLPTKGMRRPLIMGAAGVLIALVAFDVGARTGAGHAQALAAAKASAAGFAALAGGLPPQQAVGTPGGLPAALQQQLAERPTISLPAGAAAPSGGPDLFGLQH